jgi:hypothetical protein
LQIGASGENNVFYGKWIEADTLSTDFEAILQDSLLVFKNTNYARIDHYNSKKPLVREFRNAVLQREEVDNSILLSGNIQQYSPRFKEPEKPMYIALQKVRNINSEEENGRFTEKFVVFPNPFQNEINISFSMEDTENAVIYIYGTDGKLFGTKPLGTLEKGDYNYLLELSVPAGQYIITLQTAAQKRIAIINKIKN